MKYIILILIVFCFLSCSSSTNDGNRFQVVYSQGSDFTVLVRIIKDTKTGIDYLMIKKGFGCGLTALQEPHQ